MAESTLIRRADVGDAQRLSGLIERVARHCCFAPAQAIPAWFLAAITPDALAEAIARPDFAYFVGQRDGELAGVIAIREASHVHQLFVAQAWQGRGLARRLWLTAREQLVLAGDITVRSSLVAVPVYERFGFTIAGPAAEMDGFGYQPMALRLE